MIAVALYVGWGRAYESIPCNCTPVLRKSLKVQCCGIAQLVGKRALHTGKVTGSSPVATTLCFAWSFRRRSKPVGHSRRQPGNRLEGEVRLTAPHFSKEEVLCRCDPP